MNRKINSVLSKDKLVSTLSKENVNSFIERIPMKKKLLAAVSTIPFIAATTMSGSCATSCPYGMVNDPYPGQCPRYTDINGDGLCDLSQATVAATDTSTTSLDDTQTTTTDSGNGNGVNADTTNPDQPLDANATTIPDSPSLDSGDLNGDPTNYHVLPISLMLIGGYLFTYYLFEKGILKRNKHRRIWNLLVTFGYLGTGVTGVLLTIMINMGIRTALNPSLTFWHAEMAILMVIGTIIHIHIYWKPFKNMFRVLFGNIINLRKNPKTAKVTSK
jgi:hypothetical protein